MIEKFTPEEIAILKRELAEMPKDIQKRSLCDKAFKERRAIFATRPDYDGVSEYMIDDRILEIIDYTLANYENRTKYHKKTGRFRRGIFVNRNLESEYKAMAEELVGVIRKYYRKEMIHNEGESV